MLTEKQKKQIYALLEKVAKIRGLQKVKTKKGFIYTKYGTEYVMTLNGFRLAKLNEK